MAGCLAVRQKSTIQAWSRKRFPQTVVWSPEATHNFVWTPYEVQAEALSNTVTVIMYTNPEVNLDDGVWWNDTLWDTASLVEIPWPSATLLDGDVFPAPDGQIVNVTTNLIPHQATIEWDTPWPNHLLSCCIALWPCRHPSQALCWSMRFTYRGSMWAFV